MRKEFTLSEEQLTKLLAAFQPVPLIILQYDIPRSPQEKANVVWKELSKEMGFKMMTVSPSRNDQRKFSAEVKERSVKMSLEREKMMKDLPEDDPLEYQVGGDHYKNFKIQPVAFIVANKLGFLEGCIIKRICRRKPDDLDKIKHEIRLIEKLEFSSQKEKEKENDLSKTKP